MGCNCYSTYGYPGSFSKRNGAATLDTSCCNNCQLVIFIDEVTVPVTDALPDTLVADRGSIYRLPNNSFWVLNESGTGWYQIGIEDAPSDGRLYARRNGAWVEIL